jgi:hypothetical protein
MAGGWRRLHSEDLHNLYASQGDHNMEGAVGGVYSEQGRNEERIKNVSRKT